MSHRRAGQESAASAHVPTTPTRVPHPPSQQGLTASSLSDRAQEVVALRAQKHREHLLLGQMEHLADTLCQQYMHMAASTDTPQGSGGTAQSSSVPPVPEAVPVDIIRNQIEHMQFYIQHALQRQQQQRPPYGTNSIGTARDAAASGGDPRARAAAVDVPRPPAVLTTQRLVPTLLLQQPTHLNPYQAPPSSIDGRRGHNAAAPFVHATSLKTPVQEAGTARDVFDLPSSLRKKQQQRRHRGADGGERNGLETPQRAHNLGTLGSDEGGGTYDEQQQYAELPYIPNYNAVRSMIGEEHGMHVGHVQPLLDVMSKSSFGLLDCTLDGNSRCLSNRRAPVLDAVARGLREQPQLQLATSPRLQDAVLSSIVVRRPVAASLPPASTASTPRLSPRDAVAQRALEKLHHPLPLSR